MNQLIKWWRWKYGAEFEMDFGDRFVRIFGEWSVPVGIALFLIPVGAIASCAATCEREEHLRGCVEAGRYQGRETKWINGVGCVSKDGRPAP